MTLAEYYEKDIPEYYDYMYLDGYTPNQILQANRKRMQRELAKGNIIDKIRITSKVKLK